MASLTMCELPDSCASCVKCGSRLGPWLGPGQSSGPGGGPTGGTLSMGGWSRRADGWKLACRVCVCGVRVVAFVLHGLAGSAGPIEHAGPLGSLGLNGAEDDPMDFMPIEGDDL
ncbi:hypothetical protein F511_29670 [Dorcoceras hygrometricum]|uniref:Uncharacterized protein n=1 Tax=Dorcoceras hygrometricum TaxID=472368 RepID=A0A2Z7DG95_9LAMI|nr:hypothetical protein F511_29670 [Dorcoceras hygrometricum]